MGLLVQVTFMLTSVSNEQLGNKRRTLGQNFRYICIEFTEMIGFDVLAWYVLDFVTVFCCFSLLVYPMLHRVGKQKAQCVNITSLLLAYSFARR